MQNNQKTVVELDIADVLPNRFQPRIKFDENSINELALSIKKYGVIQPIVVRKIGDKYEIIAGERRYKASVVAGKQTIPAIICEMNDKDSVEIALIENVQREDLTPIEKAISYKKILDMGYVNQEELAQKVGKSQSSIANTLRLLNLSDEVQEALLENKISERHARSLLKIKDNDEQVKMLNRIINERLTVRKTDEEIDKMLNDYDVSSDFKDKDNLESEQVVKIPDIDPPSFSSNATMPGFMDIDRIAVEAKDITPEEKPKADINDLLKKDTSFPEVKPEENKEDDAMLNSGKFFRFFDANDNENSNNQTSFASNDSFFDSFNNSQPEQLDIPEIPTYEVPNMNIPSTPVTPEVQESPTSNIPTYEVPNMNIPSTPVTPEVQESPTSNIPSYEVPSMDISSTPVTPEVQEAPTSNIPSYEVPSMDIPSTPVTPEVQESPTIPNIPSYEVPNMNIPSTPEVQEAPTIPNIPSYEVPSMDIPSTPVTPEVQEAPTIPNIPSYEVPSMNISSTPVTPEVQEAPTSNIPSYEVPSMDIPSTPVTPEVQEAPTSNIPSYEVPNIEINQNVSLSDDDLFGDTQKIPPITNEQMQGEQRTSGNTIIATAPNIKLALNTVRECQNTLEKYGFIVDVEEIDFEDSYQVIFKIEK